MRYMLDISFSTVEEKDVFTQYLKNVRKHLTPEGSSSLDNCNLMLAMFDAVEREAAQAQDLPSIEMEPMDEQEASTDYVPSFQWNSGKFKTVDLSSLSDFLYLCSFTIVSYGLPECSSRYPSDIYME